MAIGFGALGSDLGAGTLSTLRGLGAAEQSAFGSVSRLSSGKSVGGAGNAARASLIGISQRLDVLVQGLNTAAGNVEQGVSLAQVAEGGLGQQAELLGRARELAVQASNDTLTNADRAQIQQEFGQIQQQLDFNANTTEFNTQKLLNGSNPSFTILAGAQGGQTETINLPDATAAGLGVAGANVSTQAGANAAIGQIDTAINNLSTARGSIGAAENRLQASLSNLGQSAINQGAAASRISDTDFASETTNLLSARLRQSANVALLAQGNALTAGAVQRLLG